MVEEITRNEKQAAKVGWACARPVGGEAKVRRKREGRDQKTLPQSAKAVLTKIWKEKGVPFRKCVLIKRGGGGRTWVGIQTKGA